jgi:superfamily II DNA/RNA helicase
LDKNFASARIARMEGKVDVDAMKAISPTSFDDVPDAEHEAVAKGLQQSLGIMKASAIHRVIHTSPDNPLVDDVAKHAAERKGKPGVIFARNREAVKMLTERLGKEGHRVVTITGSDSAQEKDRKRQMFNPEQGEAQADILVASDAGATGMNIQRGQWLYQYDTPMTAMTHAQRQGRIFRTGQKNNVELIDGVADHPEVHKARDRLQKKYGLRDLMTSSMEGLDDTGVAHYIKARQTVQDDGGSLF